MTDAAIVELIAAGWQSWLENRDHSERCRTERERAFWRGYALARRIDARLLAIAAGLPDPGLDNAHQDVQR